MVGQFGTRALEREVFDVIWEVVEEPGVSPASDELWAVLHSERLST